MAEKIPMDKVSRRAVTGDEIATRATDVNFYSTLTVLPNPDPILRKLGASEEVFDSIAADAHVMGERRTIRSGLQAFEKRLVPASDRPADIRALALCEQVLTRRPGRNMHWSDVLWQMAQSVFRGQSVHEVVWAREGQYILPQKVVDRPGRRFKYDASSELRMLSKAQPLHGEALPDYRFLVTRHMPTSTNPYGEALYSSCFWPYTFKHAGYKYFAKFCERYGFPWPIGKYPQGSTGDEINALTQSLAQMVEDAVAAVPQGTDVDVVQNSVSGSLVHESLVNLSNKEMSKALTSQTLATEIQGQGSRAASETHRQREESVHKSDREVIAASMDELFAWITAINIAGASPPTFEFYEEGEARKNWSELINQARHFIEIPTRFAHERLQIPLPEKGEPVLPQNKTEPVTAEFSAARNGVSAAEIDTGAQQIGVMVDAVKALLDASDSLADFQARLIDAYPGLSTEELREHIELGLLASQLVGATEVELIDG